MPQDWPEASGPYCAVTIEGPDRAFVVDQMLAVMGEDALQPSWPVDGSPRFHLTLARKR